MSPPSAVPSPPAYGRVMISRIPLISLAAASLLTLGLAGCSASGGGGSSDDPTDAAGGGSPSAPASSSRTTLPDACPAASVINADLGLNDGEPDQEKTATKLDCSYGGSGAASIVAMNFDTGTGVTADQVEGKLKAQGPASANFQQVKGPWDIAFYDTPTKDGAYIAGLSGTLAWHVVTGADASPSQLTKLAQDMLAQ